jgi:TolA-binding protein
VGTRVNGPRGHAALRAAIAVAVLALAAASLGAKTVSKTKPAPKTSQGSMSSPEERAIALSREALAEGNVEAARVYIAPVASGRVPRGKEDDFAYLTALLVEDGDNYQESLQSYLHDYPKGLHRREATLALAKVRYVRGEYSEAERLLTLFSPGVEKDFTGRQALVLLGLAQLARGDAVGALGMLHQAEPDLEGSPQEEAYDFALAQAALHASRPADAGNALKRLLEGHPKGDYVPQALYALGTGLEAVGRTGDAAGVFRQVMVRYPASYEATRVRDRGIRIAVEPEAPGPLALRGGFALQVGAFSRRDLAESLARDLKTSGVEDVSVKQGPETPPVFRVRAGAFTTRDEAKAMGERLRRERGFSYTIVPR